jgi:hypothetical protein
VSKSTEGKQRLTYVPKDWEEKIREWVDRHHRVRELLEELSQMSWERLTHRKE